MYIYKYSAKWHAAKVNVMFYDIFCWKPLFLFSGLSTIIEEPLIVK